MIDIEVFQFVEATVHAKLEGNPVDVGYQSMRDPGVLFVFHIESPVEVFPAEDLEGRKGNVFFQGLTRRQEISLCLVGKADIVCFVDDVRVQDKVGALPSDVLCLLDPVGLHRFEDDVLGRVFQFMTQHFFDARQSAA